MTSYAANLEEVINAAKRIEKYIHRTPVQTCRTLDEMAGCNLFFKCENLQVTGAFKFRGACNAVMQLSDADAARGVVTHSSGNHAQALAKAASLRNIKANIVMPNNAVPAKRQAVEGYEGIVTECNPTLADREKTAAKIQEETGSVLIPPYDHPHIIAGQGTATLELLDQVKDLDAVVAPVGGGGLVSGACIAAKRLQPDIKVFAAEPKMADDAAQSVAAGKLIPQTNPQTIADGLLTSLGGHTWPIIRDHIEEVVTVTEDEIRGAMRLLWERAKWVVEPSGAVPLAAVLNDAFKKKNFSRVGIIVSGGNVNLDALEKLLE